MDNRIPIPAEHMKNAISEAMLRLEEDWKDEHGVWECPWTGYEHYCLESTLELITK